MMRSVLRSWRHLYGENPLHLLAMLGCFALVGYVVSFVFPGPSALALGIWFAGAVIAHDLVLYPLYALADRPLVIARRARRRTVPRRPPLVPAINHVRVPVLGSAVLGLIYLPTITRHGEDAFRFTAGLDMAGIYRHWLLITGVLFLGSAVVYALRLGAAARRVAVRRRQAAAGPEEEEQEEEPVPQPVVPGSEIDPRPRSDGSDGVRS
ncbi:MAG TPA: hypothetical protein VGH76_01955 [Actinomycetospora sp.]|uniref:hypothetical protein n=1 Tax=Actinomycetospora sp. TaxID=1872135 RepID=UPI002F416074